MGSWSYFECQVRGVWQTKEELAGEIERLKYLIQNIREEIFFYCHNTAAMQKLVEKDIEDGDGGRFGVEQGAHILRDFLESLEEYTIELALKKRLLEEWDNHQKDY